MRPFAAGELTAAGDITTAQAQRWKCMVDASTSAVGGRVLVGLGQRNNCHFHTNMRCSNNRPEQKLKIIRLFGRSFSLTPNLAVYQATYGVVFFSKASETLQLKWVT